MIKFALIYFGALALYLFLFVAVADRINKRTKKITSRQIETQIPFDFEKMKTCKLFNGSWCIMDTPELQCPCSRYDSVFQGESKQ